MKFKFRIIGIGVAIVSILIIFGIQDEEIESEEETVFHVTLASPDNYQNGVFTKTFLMEPGDYEFGFVPNGDSPEKLSISLKGESLLFDENFELLGTPHETGISKYFTWDYIGVKKVKISETQQVEILINPNGNLLGPVSVDIIKI